MAHGTPSSTDEMPEYLRLVRGGRPPCDDLIAEMRHNYEAIGGRSPLTDITLAQAEALRERLGPGIPVAVGMRNWKPFIKEAIGALETAGADRIIGIPLAPQFSTLSVRKYVEAARLALPDGMRLDAVESFHLHPLLIEAFAERLRAGAAEARRTHHLHGAQPAGQSDRERRSICGGSRRDGTRSGRARRRHDIRACLSERGTDARAVDRSGSRDAASMTCRAQASESFSSPRSGSCATTPRFCSTSISRLPGPPASSRRR